MMDWDDLDPDDWDDFDMDSNEMGKLYAMEDMKEDREKWAIKQAYKFYDDFDSLDVDQVVKNLHALVKDKTLRESQITSMLDNMIKVFKDLEEYEKCHICNQIKIHFDVRI